MCAILAGQRRGGRRARACAEEFGLLLPACSLHDAIEVLQRVQAATPPR